MIGRQHQQQRIGLAHPATAASAARAMAGAVLRPTGSSRMACAGQSIDAQLLGDQEAMRLVAHDNGRGCIEPGHTQCRGLQHGFLAYQRQQLLGVQLARQRPEPGTGAAGKNHWCKHRSWSFRGNP